MLKGKEKPPKVDISLHLAFKSPDFLHLNFYSNRHLKGGDWGFALVQDSFSDNSK